MMKKSQHNNQNQKKQKVYKIQKGFYLKTYSQVTNNAIKMIKN